MGRYPNRTCKECVRLKKVGSRPEVIAYQKEYRKNNNDRYLEKSKQWRKNNPEAAAKLRQDRRCAKGSHTKAELRILIEDVTFCSGCGVDFSDANRFTFDHKVSIKNGGSNYIDNIQLLCGPCNFSKGRMNDDEWRTKKFGSATGGALRGGADGVAEESKH